MRKDPFPQSYASATGWGQTPSDVRTGRGRGWLAVNQPETRSRAGAKRSSNGSSRPCSADATSSPHMKPRTFPWPESPAAIHVSSRLGTRPTSGSKSWVSPKIPAHRCATFGRSARLPARRGTQRVRALGTQHLPLRRAARAGERNAPAARSRPADERSHRGTR